MLQKSINVWSIPGGLEGNLDPIDFFRIAKDNRFDVVEVAVGPAGSALGTDVTQSRCQEIVMAAAQIGVRIGSVASGLYWGRNLASESGDDRNGAKEDLKSMLQITSWLGARTLLTIPGAVDVFFMPDRPALSYRHVWDLATEGLREVLPFAEKCEVRMGIENVWNKFLMSPQGSPCTSTVV